MKAVLFLVASLFAMSAMACNPEAQFVGKVRELKTFEGPKFTFQVKLTRWFQPSMVCPMWEDEVESAVVEMDGTPSIKNGDEISGVMVFDVKTQKFHID